MASPRDRSTYVLELSVGPGGSRWAELHTYVEPKHLRAWLEFFCLNHGGLAAYHAIAYGATLGIWTIQHGTITAFLDLHPFLEASLRGHPPVSLDDKETARALAKSGEEGSEPEDDDRELVNEDPDVYERMRLSADWDAIAARLPALEPPLLAPGERTNARFTGKAETDTYIGLEETIGFGSYEAEHGQDIEPPFELDLPEAGGGDEENGDS